MFEKDLKIETLEKIKNKNAGFTAKNFKVGDTNIRVYSYHVQYENQFKNPLSREMRGITFDLDTGKIISRPFHKFFNIHEVENPEIDDIISVQEKLDGSMLHPFIYKENQKEKIWFKTKTSPFSYVAEKGNLFIKKHFPENFEKFNYILLKNNLTPIYEFFSSHNKVVIYYEEDYLKLLAVRNNITGKYIEFNSLPELFHKLKDKYDLNLEKYKDYLFIPKRYDFSFEQILKLQKEMKNEEGFVLINRKSERYKVKTLWYIERHPFTEITDRKIFEAFLSDELDDLKELLSVYGMIDVLNRVHKIEGIIQSEVRNICDTINQIKEKIQSDRTDKGKFVKELNLILNKDFPNLEKPVRSFVFNFIILDLGNCSENLISLLKEKSNVFWKVFREKF